MTHLKNIKITLLVIGILMAFAACKNNNQPENRDIQLLADSSAYNNNTFSDSSRMTQTNTLPANRNIRRERENPRGTNNSGGSGSNNSGAASGSSSNSGSSNSGSGTTQSTKKKGWSKAAQGAVIGGVGGAIGGAIISKHKGTGAAIGGAIGAAGGYIIGRSKDKKDGRVN